MQPLGLLDDYLPLVHQQVHMLVPSEMPSSLLDGQLHLTYQVLQEQLPELGQNSELHLLYLVNSPLTAV